MVKLLFLHKTHTINYVVELQEAPGVVPFPLIDTTLTLENKLGIPSQEFSRPEEQFYAIMQRGRKILEEVPPEKWFRQIARFVIGVRREVESNPGQFHPEVARFLRLYLLTATSEALDIQGKGKDSTTSIEDIAVAALNVIHDIAEAVPFDEPEQPQVRRVSMRALLERSKRGEFKNGYLLDKETKRDEQGQVRRFFKVWSPTQEKWFEFPFPKGERVLFKGGVSRVILKIAAGAPPETIEAELPPNDYDVIAYGDTKKIFREAANIGVDKDGVEIMPSGESMGLFLTQRDVTLNQAFVGGEHLYFTPEAWASAQTGIIEPLHSSRVLYVNNAIHYKGHVLSHPHIMSRMIKFVVEGKANGFDFTPLNAQIDIGCFALVLARKFSKKPNAPELLDKMYYLLMQMGQVREGESDIYAVLDRIHADNPYFVINSPNLTTDGVVRWLSRKLAGYTFRRFRVINYISSGLELPRYERDTEPYKITLEAHNPDAVYLQKVKDGWEKFVARCNERTQAYEALSDEEQEAQRRRRFERNYAR